MNVSVLSPPRPASGDFWAHLARGWDRKSALSLALLVGVGGLVGYRFSDLIDTSGGMDWLLAGTWIWMAAMLTWRVSLWHDLAYLAVGLVGGTVIEWWGTVTEIWSYFTLERPPPWILPAWPIATLAIDRMARMLDRGVDELFGRRGIPDSWFFIAYAVSVPAFVVSMIAFARHTAHLTATQVVIALMAFVTLACRNPRRDFLLFGAGSFLGIFLEYWGTSRQCWTYYTGEVPPAVAAVAHGFAAIAFARGADAVTRAFAWVQRRPAAVAP
ncbi:MAG: hypothetical protein U0263_03660 [Polyangiaceae bacterium]